MAIKTHVSASFLKDSCVMFIAAMLFAVLAGCAGSPTRESTGELIDDTTITTKVKTALIADREVAARYINVKTFKGNVQLSGFVRSENERQKAEQVARSIGGVKAVANSLEVQF